MEKLITYFKPEHYNVFLNIARKERKVYGKVDIKGEALQEIVYLHQKDLEIKSVMSFNENLSFEKDDKNESVKIELNKTGDTLLTVEFELTITDNMTGIYPSYYNIDGVKKEIISTQFESHFAREAFPCIDEPLAKATFDLSIKFDEEEGEVVISNMPEINVENRKNTGIWQFDTTPKMSTYLLAFAVGDFQKKLAKTKHNTEVGVFSSKAHNIDTLDFALDIAVRVIEFYEDYFGVKYPLPHSYHVGLPDFSAGAMENWGLVTYREIYLLVDKNSSFSSKQSVALVVAHEIAHQWFGNLVTMKWWDDLWLNESFANMMEYLSIDRIMPNWHIFEDFQTSGVIGALKRDATDGVQSVHVEVKHPDEINTLFDPDIVYAKGSRLMHMLHRWLGDDNFAKGLNGYFNKHMYSNTVGSDLWAALGKASNKDVASFMNSWLEQPGYPVLTAKIIKDELHLSQKQFFIGEHQDKNRLWEIPLNSNFEGMPDVLKEEKMVVKNYAELKKKNKGILRFNTENTAHYIVNYEGELLDDLIKNFKYLDSISKLQLIRECELLAESSYGSYKTLIKLLENSENETSYLVNSGILSIINNLKMFIDENSKVEEKFKKIVDDKFSYNYERLGFESKENEKPEDEFVREITIGSLMYADNKKVIEDANLIYEKYEDNLENIPANIRADVLINQIKYSETEDLVEKYIDLYVKANNFNFKKDIMFALTKTKNQKTIERILSMFKDKNYIKPQDLVSWYVSLLRNSTFQKTAWQFMCKEWQFIVDTFAGDMSFDYFVIAPSNIFKTKEMLDEYVKFFDDKKEDVSIRRSILMGINKIEARVKLVEREKDLIAKEILNLK